MLLRKKIIIVSLLTVAGAISGYIYYNQVGCNNGCAIWSHPWRSTGYGGLLGLLFGMTLLPDKK